MIPWAWRKTESFLPKTTLALARALLSVGAFFALALADALPFPLGLG